MFILIPLFYTCNSSLQERNSALVKAAFFGHTDIVKILLSSGAYVNLANKVSCTCIISHTVLCIN